MFTQEDKSLLRDTIAVKFIIPLTKETNYFPVFAHVTQKLESILYIAENISDYHMTARLGLI